MLWCVIVCNDPPHSLNKTITKLLKAKVRPRGPTGIALDEFPEIPQTPSKPLTPSKNSWKSQAKIPEKSEKSGQFSERPEGFRRGLGLNESSFGNENEWKGMNSNESEWQLQWKQLPQWKLDAGIKAGRWNENAALMKNEWKRLKASTASGSKHPEVGCPRALSFACDSFYPWPLTLLTLDPTIDPWPLTLDPTADPWLLTQWYCITVNTMHESWNDCKYVEYRDSHDSYSIPYSITYSIPYSPVYSHDLTLFHLIWFARSDLIWFDL